MTTTRRPLSDYLAMQYPFKAVASEDGGYFVTFPDLPGCMTQVEEITEIPAMAEEARQLWIETEYEDGEEIPLPSYPGEYSGKFNVRIPRSLHRALASSAERDGVSLNQYVTGLLAAGDAGTRLTQQVEESLSAMREELHALHSRLNFNVAGVPAPGEHDIGHAVKPARWGKLTPLAA
jgi:antitoxin HicB